jgi:SAM-dependent MidA family methyltransferase
MALQDAIMKRIAESHSHRITFAEFMELALYHPQFGYYTVARPKIGATGDFFTAPHLAADFGELLADQFAQCWQILGCPAPFTLIEMGAGQGILAMDIVGYLQRAYPVLLENLQYVIVERSLTHIREQQQQLSQWLEVGAAIRWCGLEEIPLHSVQGCFFSNELVDAFPVHQVIAEAGDLKEIYVAMEETADGFRLTEVIDQVSTPMLIDYFTQLDIDLTAPPYGDLYRTEVNLAVKPWLETIATRLDRGYVLTIDYGYPSDRYYHPNRSSGTLQCYYRHSHHSDPYANLGQQDITAHVNFTALERFGGACGLATVGSTKQAAFLMALGLGDRIAAISQSPDATLPNLQALLQRRSALHDLINPMGFGEFGVLIQSKGVPSLEPLKGLLSFGV